MKAAALTSDIIVDYIKIDFNHATSIDRRHQIVVVTDNRLNRQYSMTTTVGTPAAATMLINNDNWHFCQDRLKTEIVDGQSRSIVYDNTDQVKTVTGSNTEAYTYDKNGNRSNANTVRLRFRRRSVE